MQNTTPEQREALQGLLGAVQQGWWMFLIRGLAAIVFGILALAWPDLTLFVLIIAFGIYVMFDGVLEIYNGFANRSEHGRWWVDILIGLAGVVAGILIISLPGITAVVAMYYIGAWMVVTGVLQIIYAIKVREQIEGEWLLVVSGLISVILGIVFFIWPGGGAVSLVWLIAIYAILIGIALSIFALRARKGFQ